jgi:hypothetical protein
MNMLWRHRRVWQPLAVLALLSNLVVAPAPLKHTPLVDSVLGLLVLCTAHDAGAAAADSERSKTSPSEHCPACTLAPQPGPAVAIAAASVVYAAPTTAKLSAPATDPLALHLSDGGVRSRAPPASLAA